MTKKSRQQKGKDYRSRKRSQKQKPNKKKKESTQKVGERERFIGNRRIKVMSEKKNIDAINETDDK